jgi:ABC-type transport system substrate-binding protein
MSRREFLKQSTAWSALAALPASTIAQIAVPPKTFRWAFPAAETGFDPAQISDLYSNYVLSHIFEPPLQYDFLARPSEFMPRTAATMPVISADSRVITVTIRPGIFFQPDPAFKGQPRELTAADHVHQFKRLFDPRWKSPNWSIAAKSRPVGLQQLRDEATRTGSFDYDRVVAGARVLSRYAFEIRLDEPDPRYYQLLADARFFGAVAREVVEANPDDIMARPVGTGPFMLASWRRASRIVLERSPTFREEYYEARAPADDPLSRQINDQLRGKRLPMVDRVEISVISETQPAWLSFLNGTLDIGTPGELLNTAAPLGRLSPSLERRGIRLERTINPDVVVTYFNMEDSVLGGYTPDRVALRRALSLAYNLDEEIRLVRRGQLIPGQSPIPPNTFGYDPQFVSEMSRFDRAQAKALLDLFGYVDRDGDGWREQPDGRPLLLTFATSSDQISRAFNELWKKNMDAIGVRMQFQPGQWPEQLKAARAGQIMIWALGWSASAPDGETFLDLAYGPNAAAANLARFNLPEYDALFRRQHVMHDSPERLAIMTEMKRLLVAYMPYKFHGHRIVNTFVHPWVVGFRRHPYARDFFKWVDIDRDAAARLQA